MSQAAQRSQSAVEIGSALLLGCVFDQMTCVWASKAYSVTDAERDGSPRESSPQAQEFQGEGDCVAGGESR